MTTTEGDILGFDLETTGLAGTKVSARRGQEQDPDQGITCAAVWSASTQKTTLCYGSDETPRMDREGHSMAAERLSRPEAVDLVRYLLEKQKAGDIIVTWNGASFDFAVLAKESGLFEECRDLARQHIDIAFLMLCVKGFMAGLSATGEGMGLGGKPEGMDGSVATILWNKDHSSQRRVLHYVASDAELTGRIYLKTLEQGYARWTTTSGRLSTWAPPTVDGRLLVVEEALQLPLPDTSWMTRPRTREDCLTWMTPQEAQAVDGNGVSDIDLDATELDGELLHLDLAHSEAARAAAATYAHLVATTAPTLSQRVQQLIAKY